MYPINHLRHALALGCCLLLFGCGWHLRGMGEHGVVLPPLQVDGTDTQFVAEWVDALKEMGVSVNSNLGGDVGEHAWQMHVAKFQYARKPGAINPAGQAASYLLSLSVQFDLTRPAGNDPSAQETHFGPYTVNASRDLQYDQSAVLGKDAEEQVLRRSLISDCAQQASQRLRAATKR